ncbi:(Fe-S)-binding protein [Desulfosarcina cetonica]|uniref:(Fe-S)-binding protein n=1 Tax=Desulfosarcina cetonica TaxID=90730 RepID=UPI00248CA10D|nr:(Fe-S)-binding protein [Desulfosarcina cetonica]
MGSACTDCGACQTRCAFLRHYGTPRTIARTYDFSRPAHQQLAFECSLCNLCNAVCPEGLAPGDLFLAIRRAAMTRANGNLSRYRAILTYERWGISPLFSYYALPKGGDTVFFPGCALPGSRPAATWQLFDYLRQGIPDLGIVFDCCTKPSHDLGRQTHFETLFGEMRDYLVGHGIRRVLVACPSCHQMFSRYGGALAVETVYEVLDNGRLPGDVRGHGELTIHDPCPLRGDRSSQDAVRSLVSRMGLAVVEMRHRRERTLCCGEGGSVGFVRPQLAREWAELRQKEAGGRRLLTYCAGCAGILGRQMPTLHLMDLIFFPQQALNGGAPVTGGVRTYLNRLKLKGRAMQTMRPAVTRVRPLKQTLAALKP